MANRLTPQIIDWSQSAERVFGVAAAMNIAAAIEESGLGAATPPGSNNWHGIKGSGPATDTREQTAGGVWYTVKSGFHMFRSPADSFQYYAWLISHGEPYAVAWRAWLASPRKNADVETLTRAIAVKYATALAYAKALVSIETYDKLFGYDTLPAPAPVAAAAPSSLLTPKSRAALITPEGGAVQPDGPVAQPSIFARRLDAVQNGLATVKEQPREGWIEEIEALVAEARAFLNPL